MVDIEDTDSLRRSAFEHLWMHNRDWVQTAEEGGPTIIVEGDGIRVTDSEGKTWIDVNGGYSSVNVGYGRTEIAEAAREQMNRFWQPDGMVEDFCGGPCLSD
jgi:adenosylmethionine-8-amino-7-oxononanoate aminotransferase